MITAPHDVCCGSFGTFHVNNESTRFHRATHQSPVEALVYVALPNNSLYLGPKAYPDMAREIVASHVSSFLISGGPSDIAPR